MSSGQGQHDDFLVLLRSRSSYLEGVLFLVLLLPLGSFDFFVEASVAAEEEESREDILLPQCLSRK